MASFALLSLLGQSAVLAQYHNPVIPGYHPDPSVCRVGDDFYLVNSSFQYFPGVPIFQSRDLVHWTQIGNVLDRESQLPLKGASSWLGIYAPTIRYNNGTFYMITTNVGNGGNFMVTATDPRGPWSEPIWLNQQGIDPSLYFENGKCYMVSNPDNTITLCQIDPKTGKQLTESRAIWQGTGGRYPEGPHIYKKDGWYYLLISEGGTEIAHKLTIARSKNIYGPDTANPANPILTHCSMAGQTNPIQGTGHGDFVQAKDGSWWVVFLGFRFFNGSYHHLGRETFLAPVEWKPGGWPLVNNGHPVDTMMHVQLPVANPVADTEEPLSQKAAKPSAVNETATSFGDKLGPEWIYIQNPDSTHYRLVGGKLRLVTSNSSLTDNDRPTFIGRRQESENFILDTKVTLTDVQPGDEGGLTVYQINDGHVDFYLQNYKNDIRVKMRSTIKGLRCVLAEKSIGKRRTVWLRVASNGRVYKFTYSFDGKRYHWLDQLDCALLSTEVVGGFTGVVLGMYAWRGGAQFNRGQSWMDFDYFNYKEN